MASNTRWSEDSGNPTGSPAKGTTRTTGVANCNWGATDGPIADPSATPIPAGQNSYPKFLHVEFQSGGSFTQVSNGKFGHSAGALPSNVTLFGKVTSSYLFGGGAPSQAAPGGLDVDMTAVDASLAAGLAVNFSTVGPEGASPTASIVGTTLPVFTQYLVTQVRVGGAAAPGLFPNDVTIKFQWDET